MALATGGVKNRSRNEVAISRWTLLAGVRLGGARGGRGPSARGMGRGVRKGEGFPPPCPQKLETTAVKTSLMVAGLLAA